MSRNTSITAWADHWHTSERTSHAYTEVIRNPPDGRLYQGPAALAKTKSDEKPSREAESMLSRFLTRHALTGKYSQRFLAERAILSVCEGGFSPQTANHAVFDCPCHDAARAANPRFDFDHRAGRRIKRLHGMLRSAIRTRALLRFLETARACFKPHTLRDPGCTERLSRTKTFLSAKPRESSATTPPSLFIPPPPFAVLLCSVPCASLVGQLSLVLKSESRDRVFSTCMLVVNAD
jgi:hypothetical protein